MIPAASVIRGPQVAGCLMGANPWKNPNDTGSYEHVFPVNQRLSLLRYGTPRGLGLCNSIILAYTQVVLLLSTLDWITALKSDSKKTQHSSVNLNIPLLGKIIVCPIDFR